MEGRRGRVWCSNGGGGGLCVVEELCSGGAGGRFVWFGYPTTQPTHLNKQSPIHPQTTIHPQTPIQPQTPIHPQKPIHPQTPVQPPAHSSDTDGSDIQEGCIWKPALAQRSASAAKAVQTGTGEPGLAQESCRQMSK